MANEVKSDAIMDLMKQHLSTDAGNELTKKIGLVYQINIAPKGLFSIFNSSSSSTLFLICVVSISRN
ncbi:unnamed protein product [Arabis nemorensis]|uniref:Uncharacterized protein n=1 Tax=Arabis nemorensis TaxID=586526 RepID=A0A565ATL8_9BRAS|nr:unnamed protein product [Arabis nemorensis]